jgi:hypothetical protein
MTRWSRWPIAVVWIPSGVVFGLLLEGAINPDRITYTRLRGARPGLWSPHLRIFNAIIVGAVFAVLLGAHIVQLGALGISLGEFATTRPYCSFIIGVLAGSSSPVIVNAMRKLFPSRRQR